MALEIECPRCQKRLSVDPSPRGEQTVCPFCQAAFTIAPPAPPQAAPTIFCAKCGQPNPDNNYKCLRCGFVLHEVPPQKYVVTEDGTLGGLIPYKNAQALWAYYLGIFSLLPCLGGPLGIAAFILGLRGLSFAKRHPEAKGAAHAWIGIVLGAVCGLGYALLGLLILVGIMRH